MEWLNIPTALLRGEDFLGCEPTDRASWLCLVNYCAGQENGGVIRDCDTWGDRKWQQVCGITKKEAARTCALWRWDGHDLTVHFYPADQERMVLTKRANGKTGGRPKKAEKEPKHDSRLSNPEPKTDSRLSKEEPKPNRSGNVKECKEKKDKETETENQIPAAPGIDPTDITTPGPAPALTPEDRERYDLNEIKLHGGDIAPWFRLQWVIVIKLWTLPLVLSTLDAAAIGARTPKGIDAAIRKLAESPERPSLADANKFAEENADMLIEMERKIAAGTL